MPSRVTLVGTSVAPPTWPSCSCIWSRQSWSG